MVKWLFGIPYEIAFWDAGFRNAQTRKSLFAFSHYGQSIQLTGFDVEKFLLQQTNPTEVKILDVGCGMTYYPGDKLYVDGEEKQINIHYIDPLAHYYNKILEKYKINRPNIEFGMMEYLSAFYPKHDVTLIIIQNALDHSADPVKGILEALQSLQVNGILYLNHHPNEAEFENYRGFHQFNITLEENDDLIIWNKKNRFNINELFSNYISIENKIIDNNVISILRKIADIPQNYLEKDNDIQKLGKALLDYSFEVNSPTKMLQYHLKLWYYRMIQNVSKMFSWKSRQRIKEIVNKLIKKI
jgi:hypothetical protein